MPGDKNKPLDLLLKAKGRAASSNVTSRFNQDQRVYDVTDADYYAEDDEIPNLQTEFYVDHAKTILNRHDSPDLGGGGINLNPYRGCEHGCIYCYARPTHEYFGLSAGLDFESKIFYKEKAPELLEQELMKSRWVPQVIQMSGISDCYQPVERKLELTRKCLEVLARFRNPVGIITKNFLVTRDIDILSEMAKEHLVWVCISVTTLDVDLARKMEPRTSSPGQRLEAIRRLTDAGVPVYVNVAPVVPGLTDHEVPKILEAASKAGAKSAGYVVARLPHSVKDLFIEWLDKSFPEKRDRVIGAIRGVRDGKLYKADFETRMVGKGPQADHIREMFNLFRRKYFPAQEAHSLRTDLFRRPPRAGEQMGFDLA